MWSDRDTPRRGQTAVLRPQCAKRRHARRGTSWRLSAAAPGPTLNAMFTTTERRLAFGDFEFEPATGDLYCGRGLVPLTPKALSLLGYLVLHAGRLVSKDQMLDAI